MRRTELDDGGEPPSREQAEALLAQLPDRPGCFISFQDHDALALNPAYSNEVTPQGIYAFPAEWLRLVVAAHARTGGAKTRLSNQGCVRREHAFVFTATGRVIEPPHYRDYLTDAGTLHAWLTARHEVRALDVLGAFTNNGCPKHGGDLDGRRLWLMTEKVTDCILDLYGPDEPFLTHPEKPALWREVFAAMGVDGLLDRQSMLTGGDFPQQLAVFNPEAIQLQAHFSNPCRREPPAVPRPR